MDGWVVEWMYILLSCLFQVSSESPTSTKAKVFSGSFSLWAPKMAHISEAAKENYFKSCPDDG